MQRHGIGQGAVAVKNKTLDLAVVWGFRHGNPVLLECLWGLSLIFILRRHKGCCTEQAVFSKLSKMRPLGCKLV